MKSDSDHEVRLDISGADKNSLSGNHPNTEDVHLHPDQDSCLRPRKKVAAKTNLIATTSQSQQQAEEDTGHLKTKSSTIEPAIPSQTENIDKVSAIASSSEILETPKAASPVTLRTPLLASQGEANDDDDENGHSPTREKAFKPNFIRFGLVGCFYIMLVLIPCAAMNKLEYKYQNVEIWKWCCLGLPVFLVLIITDWLKNILMEKITPLDGKDQFLTDQFFYSLANSCQVHICLILTSSIWWYLIGPRETESIDATKILRYILNGMESATYVAFIWVLRSLAIAYLYVSFYDKRFSKRIQENRFHQYVLKTLSGTPVRELSEVHSSRSVSCRGSNVIDVQTPQGITRWMIEATIRPNTLDESKDLMNPDEQNNRIITIERDAKAAGDLIFRNVAKPEHKYIEKEDLLRFMKKEEVDMVLPWIEGKEESGRIDEKPFLNWVVSMYMKSKFLEHSLNDIKEAMETLLKFGNVVLIVALIILWVILMDIATTEVLLFLSSQFLLAVFTFGNSAKSIFEAMIFVILKHPFDVGDRCVIDGVQVVVEKVSILTAVFLKYDNEKIYYPNSILVSKSISNLDRSPEMRDTVEFELDVSTSVDVISDLRAEIKTYIDSKPYLWRPKHSVRVREIADVNKMKMRLCVTHTLNFPDYEEKCDRISNLVLELRNIFQQLGIKSYQILPPTSSD